MPASHNTRTSLCCCGNSARGFTARAGTQGRFIPVLNSLIVWLFIRSVAFAVDRHRYAEPLKGRLLAVAATNLILAATLVSGLPVALMVTGLFGPTDELVASIAWILAVSFVATALLQLSLASQAPHMGQGRATIDRGGQNARGSST